MIYYTTQNLHQPFPLYQIGLALSLKQAYIRGRQVGPLSLNISCPQPTDGSSSLSVWYFPQQMLSSWVTFERHPGSLACRAWRNGSFQLLFIVWRRRSETLGHVRTMPMHPFTSPLEAFNVAARQKEKKKSIPATLHLPVSVAHVKDIMFQSADLLRKHACGELSCIVLSLSRQKINVSFWPNRSVAWILHKGHLEETDAAPSCSTSSGITVIHN